MRNKYRPALDKWTMYAKPVEVKCCFSANQAGHSDASSSSAQSRARRDDSPIISITHKKRCSGFSLVEAIVAGAIVAIVGVVIITVLNLFHSQVNEGTLRAMIQMDYDMVSQEIGSKVHAAKWVLAGDEAWAQSFPGERTVDTIKMLMPDQTVPVMYGINRTDSLLREKVGGDDWGNFLLGSRTVKVTPGSGFTVSQNRKTLELRLVIVKRYRSKSDSLVIQEDRYVCKNN